MSPGRAVDTLHGQPHTQPVGVDIALVGVGWLLVWWTRLPRAAGTARAPRWSTIRSEGRAEQVLRGLGIGLAVVGTVNIVLELTDYHSVWQQILWNLVGIMLAVVITVLILEGPRALWMRLRRRSAAG